MQRLYGAIFHKINEYFDLLVKLQRKPRGVSKIIRIPHLGTVDTCTKPHCHPSNIVEKFRAIHLYTRVGIKSIHEEDAALDAFKLWNHEAAVNLAYSDVPRLRFHPVGSVTGKGLPGLKMKLLQQQVLSLCRICQSVFFSLEVFLMD